MESPVELLIDAKPWSRWLKEVEPNPRVLVATVFAIAVGVVGFILPWYTVAYAPPAGSVTIIDGTKLVPFSHTYSGFAPERAGLLLMPIPSIPLGEDVITGAQFSAILFRALIAVGLATILAVPALAPIKSSAVKVLRQRWAQAPVSIAHAGALLVEALGCVAFLLLALGLGSIGSRQVFARYLGGTPQANQIAGYLHVDIGIGFWLVLASVIGLVTIRAKQFFTMIGIILLGVVVLAFAHQGAWIGSFMHSLGF